MLLGESLNEKYMCVLADFDVPKESNVASSSCRSWCLGSSQWNTLACGQYSHVSLCNGNTLGD